MSDCLGCVPLPPRKTGFTQYGHYDKSRLIYIRLGCAGPEWRFKTGSEFQGFLFSGRGGTSGGGGKRAKAKRKRTELGC